MKPINTILMLNAGSSSVKFKLYAKSSVSSVLSSGKVSNLGGAPCFTVDANTFNGQNVSDKQTLPKESTQNTAVKYIFDWLDKRPEHWRLHAVTHRIVHGGTRFTKSVRLTPAIMDELRTLVPLAPLHQPYNLDAIEIVKKNKPNILQFACFDTAFHANQDRLFTTYALPETLRQQGIRRYGFHGLSYEWLIHFLQKNHPELANGRIIAAHLGNGSSLCAIKNGMSVDTTMGMTALAGLPMGTRCGELDPGIVIYLIRELGLSVEEVESILYEQSGLLGLSTITNDVKTLQNSENENAQFALDYFCLKVAQHMGMMAVSLGGVDTIIFTGGIGENSDFIRNQILSHLDFIKPFDVKVIPADEEQIMAIHTLKLLEENTN